MLKFLKSFRIIIDELTLIRPKVIFLNSNKPPVSWSKGKKGDIVLIQGLLSNPLDLEKLGNHLNSIGYRIHILQKLRNNTMKTKKAMGILENYISTNRLENIILVGHSKGGIIIKYFLNNSQHANKVKIAFCISTPFKGSFLAYFIFREFSPTSQLIRNINLKKSVNKRVINLYSKFDELIIPNKNLLLDNAKNIRVDVIGHVRAVFSRKTYKEIVNNL